MAKKATGSQKLYRNAGTTELVFEGVIMEPGAEFEVTLTPEHETQLIAGGHIEVLRDQSAKADRAQAQAAEDAAPSTASATAAEDTNGSRKARGGK